jgi:hypothetical protein
MHLFQLGNTAIAVPDPTPQPLVRAGCLDRAARDGWLNTRFYVRLRACGNPLVRRSGENWSILLPNIGEFCPLGGQAEAVGRSLARWPGLAVSGCQSECTTLVRPAH